MLGAAMTDQADFSDGKPSFPTHYPAIITKSDNPAVRRQNIWQNIEELLETTILVPVVRAPSICDNYTAGQAK